MQRQHITRPIVACGHCGESFQAHMTKAGWSKFCSKPCHAASQRKRVSIACAHCGKKIEKIPSRLAKYESAYCSNDCAHAAHGERYRRENHHGWRGGSLTGRGPSWPKARESAIQDAGEQCADCGMTRDEHHAKYGKDLHVHHRTPYRLSLDNSQDNLIVLCIPCHGKEESAQRRNLSPADFEIMRQRSERDRALGLNHNDYSHLYEPCPQCGVRKCKKAKLCRKCSLAARHPNPGQQFVCPKCGGTKKLATPGAVCLACHRKRQREERAAYISPHSICPECGGPKSHGNPRCRACRLKRIIERGAEKRLVKMRCPKCGGYKHKQSTLCRGCYHASRPV